STRLKGRGTATRPGIVGVEAARSAFAAQNFRFKLYNRHLDDENKIGVGVVLEGRRDAMRDRYAVEKDQPLQDDVRLLGQFLGDTVREQEGERAFETVEAIRRFSVAFQRRADVAAGRDLDELLNRLSPAEAVTVIRAFSYFSHLANLAEDRHHVRRRLVHEVRQEPQDGSLAKSFSRLRKAGVAPEQVERALQRSFVSPVLTAHPTEVQRKSTLDAERAIADTLGAREQLANPRRP